MLQEKATTSQREYEIVLLEELVPDLIDGENPTGALYAKEGEVAVRVTAVGRARLS